MIPVEKSFKYDAALPMLAMKSEMKIQATTHGNKGLTLTEVLVTICVVILVMFVVMSGVGRPRMVSRINCINNLKEASLAAKIWAGDNDDRLPGQMAMTNEVMMKLIGNGHAYVLWQTMSNELSTPKILHCWEDTKRHYATNFDTSFSDANISYFMNLDAGQIDPQSILIGDDNLAINGKPVQPGILNIFTSAPIGWTTARTGKYHGPGNIALADGSAQQTTSQTLQQAFQQSGSATNRLVIP